MEQFYRFAGISRQGFHQRLSRKSLQDEITQLLIKKGLEVRNEKNHPRMGARSIFYHLKMCEPSFLSSIKIGVNKFEKTLLDHGFRLPRVTSYRITTRGNGFRFPNLIKGKILNNINQVWSSDITYWEVYLNHKKIFFYLTLIMDIYSRRVIGYSLSKKLTTEVTTIPALQMCWKIRNFQSTQNLSGLIFHSDAGGQYYDAVFLSMLEEKQIKSSMAEKATDNAYSERLNGVLKNQYLLAWSPSIEKQLLPLVQQAIWAYNNEKPHRALNHLSPVLFEKKMLDLPDFQRTQVIIKG